MIHEKRHTLYLIFTSEYTKNELTTYPVSELYDSELFTACLHYVEAEKTPWLLFSVLHGLLWPSSVVAPYDLREICAEEQKTRINQQLDCLSTANTIGSILNLQQQVGCATPLAKKQLLERVSIVVLGNSPSLNLAMNELTNLGCTVEAPLINMSEIQQINWLRERAKPVSRANELK